MNSAERATGQKERNKIIAQALSVVALLGLLQISQVKAPEYIPEDILNRHAALSRGSLAAAQERYQTLTEILKNPNSKKQFLLSEHNRRSAIYGQNEKLACVAIFNFSDNAPDLDTAKDVSLAETRFITSYCNIDDIHQRAPESFNRSVRLNGCFTKSLDIDARGITIGSNFTEDTFFARPPRGSGKCKVAY